MRRSGARAWYFSRKQENPFEHPDLQCALNRFDETILDI
jgi:hypothetical protein